MEATNLSPTPPDRIFAIALGLVVIFGAAEIAIVAVHFVGPAWAEYAAAHRKAPAVPAAAPAAAPKNTVAPVDQPALAPVAVQSPPSVAALSVADRLLKDATELRDRGDTTNALARLQEAAQSDPKNANVLAQMAMIYESIQLFERSNETWRKIQEIGPSAGALYDLADRRLKNGVSAPASATTGPSPAGAAPLDAGTARNEAEGIPDGSMFGITEVTTTDYPGSGRGDEHEVEDRVKARPNTVIDHTRVKIQVFFYDTTDTQEAVLTDADVSYEWLTPHHDWKDTNPEVLAVTYLRPRNKPVTPETALSAAAAAVKPPGRTKKKSSAKKESSAELPAEGGHRKYLGYIVRIYYTDELQAVRADPPKLLNLFPPPFTAPSQ